MIEDEEDQYCKCLMDEGELDLEEKHFICMHAALSLCDGKSIESEFIVKLKPWSGASMHGAIQN